MACKNCNRSSAMPYVYEFTAALDQALPAARPDNCAELTRVSRCAQCKNQSWQPRSGWIATPTSSTHGTEVAPTAPPPAPSLCGPRSRRTTAHPPSRRAGACGRGILLERLPVQLHLRARAALEQDPRRRPPLLPPRRRAQSRRELARPRGLIRTDLAGHLPVFPPLEPQERIAATAARAFQRRFGGGCVRSARAAADARRAAAAAHRPQTAAELTDSGATPVRADGAGERARRRRCTVDAAPAAPYARRRDCAHRAFSKSDM